MAGESRGGWRGTNLQSFGHESGEIRLRGLGFGFEFEFGFGLGRFEGLDNTGFRLKLLRAVGTRLCLGFRLGLE
jgi:hypothetical protein